MASDNPFENQDTKTRMEALDDRGFVIVVTRAFGPNGEDLIDYDGPTFSGEPGVKLRVTQGDVSEDVVLSPYYGDPSKIFSADFESGEPCQLSVPETGAPLDKIPGMKTDEGGEFFAVYLTPKLGDGELVAVNNIWGNTNSQMLSEGDILKLYAEMEDPNR